MAMLERAQVAPVLGAPLLNQVDGLAQIAVGRAWTLLTRTALRGHEDDVVALALADPEAVATISLAWRPAAIAPATRAFVALVTEAPAGRRVEHPSDHPGRWHDGCSTGA